MAIKSVLLGILAALFFSLTFLLNEINLHAAGDWVWVSTLRYLWMLPMIAMLAYVPQVKANFHKVWLAIKDAPFYWLLWSNVCFVLFYVPLTWAAQFLPGWLVSSLWQLTIIFGVLTTPLMKVTDSSGVSHRLQIPRNKLKWMVIIVIGIAMTTIQTTGFAGFNHKFWFAVIAILIAAICYPLGEPPNRRSLPRFQRVRKSFWDVDCDIPNFHFVGNHWLFAIRIAKPYNALKHVHSCSVFWRYCNGTFLPSNRDGRSEHGSVGNC